MCRARCRARVLVPVRVCARRLAGCCVGGRLNLAWATVGDRVGASRELVGDRVGASGRQWVTKSVPVGDRVGDSG